jgi:hypothetical protein
VGAAKIYKHQETRLRNSSGALPRLVGGIFCDLKRVFDCVNHNTLLSKLEFYGMVGKASALIKSYLSDRYQKVVVNDGHMYSDWGKIENVVPKDRFLDPYHFYCI